MCGLLLSRKCSFLWAYGSLCNDGPSTLKNKGTMLKNDVNISFLFVLKKFIATLHIIIDSYISTFCMTCVGVFLWYTCICT
jgi:hypothetical protein